MNEQNMFDNEFDRMYGDSYRNENSNATNPDHVLPGNTERETQGGESLTTATAEGARELADSVKPAEREVSLDVYGHSVEDYVNTMLPNGAPEGSRHKFALKVASDAIILYDGDMGRVSQLLQKLPFVQEIISERGMLEIDRIISAAKKRMEKREAEHLYDPLPSKDMRRAIEQVTGRKYNALVMEVQKSFTGHGANGEQADIIQLLERLGGEIEKLFPHYELLRLLCHRLKRRHYVAALFVGGAFCMTLMTRSWYRSGMEPGRVCRLNSILELIGRSGSGKHIAVDLYRLLMEPVKRADQAQVDALNRWNQEREQKSGGEKNKSPRPKGVFRCMPSETSAAAIREAEFNAKEMIDGEEWPLHIFHFNSELQDLQRQMKKEYMNIEKLFYKGFHNEPDGSYLKTSSAIVGEYDVHFNGVYSGTQSALEKQTTTANFSGGLLFRLTVVPLGDSNFEMRENREYTDEDAKRDARLREWAYFFDTCKGEIPCQNITDALHQWTDRRMKDAKEEKNFALEDIVKRPYWHGANYALPFIISRHADKMVEDGAYHKCGPDFSTDKYDKQLALLIVNAQFLFQQYFFLAIGEKYYDDQQSFLESNTHHQRKTWLGYHRLPNPFTPQDVDECFGYEGKKGSISSKIKRLQDDGLAQKIRTGENKGKYRKLMK